MVDKVENAALAAATMAVADATAQAVLLEAQLEARDGSVTILDTTGGGTNNANLTQVRDPLSPEPAGNPKHGSDRLWDGFTGSGYLDMGMNAGDAVAFDVTAPTAGTYTVSVRYANGGTANRPLALTVDGVQLARLPFAPTSAWDAWQEASVEVPLEAGVNTIRLAIPGDVATFTGPNLDRVTVSSDAGPDVEPGSRETIKINFQDGTAPKAPGYLVDNFRGFGNRGNGESYGWVTEASAIDADGTTATPINSSAYPAIAINERSGTGTLPADGSLPEDQLAVNFGAYDPRLTGYAHFSLGSYPARAAWEIALEDGWYEVTVSIGDTGGPNDSNYKLYVERELASSFTPTSAHKSELVTTLVEVNDGFLTLSAQGGTVTEMQYLEVRALPDITPGDAREAPEDYAAFVDPTAISADATVALDPTSGRADGIDPTSDVVLGIDVVEGRGGALLESLGDGSVRLYETLTGLDVPYNANTTGGFDSLTIAPTMDLKPFTSYTLVIDGFQDRGDNSDPSAPTREFQKFSTTFVTGATPVVEAREVAFADTVEVVSSPALGESYTSIEMSPNKEFFYATSITGTITRWAVNLETGAIIDSSKEVFAPQGDFNVPTSDGGARRGIIGIAFDPEDANTIWITDNYPIPLNGRSNSVPEFSGRISKVTLGEGGSLADATIKPYATGLPRSNGDHVTNSLEFRPNPNAGQAGEPNFLLYLTQGSNSAMGQADSAWGLRPERLLNASILEIDHTQTPPAGGFKLATEPLPADGLNRRFADSDGDLKNGPISITSGEWQGNFLVFAENGSATVQNAAGNVLRAYYNPFAEDAPVRIYAEGTRNAYDLVWHSNGYLYVPTNGSAAGGNVPNDPDTAENEGLTNVGLQRDYLFRVVEDGYYGHPNPLHDNFVQNGGNPTSATDPNEVGNYPVGTLPDPDYDLLGTHSLGTSRSPNGVIEYTGSAFGASLQNAVIFTQYSSGDNLRAVTLNADGTVAQDFVLRDPDGQIVSYVDPLDVIEGTDGRLYMLTLNRATGVSQIVRLEAAPGGVVPDRTADAGGDLALVVIDASNPAAVVFQVNGLDVDIQTVTVSFNGGPPQTVTLDTESRFTQNFGAQTGSVTAALAVADASGNTATRTTAVTLGQPSGGPTTIDASAFTRLDLDSGTIIRRIDNPATHETNTANDANGDGMNDGYNGLGYVDMNGGAEDKVSFTYTAPAAGEYSLTFRVASTTNRPIAVQTGDQSVAITNTSTGSFTTWSDRTVTLTLKAGANTIVLEQTGTAGPNIDSVTVAPLGGGTPNVQVQSLDPAYFDDRLHFSWIDNPSVVVPSTPRDFKESATVRISNTGSGPLEIEGATISGPFRLADPSVFEGVTLGAGQSIDVAVIFNRSALTPRANGVSGVYDGTLTLQTSDPDNPTTTVDLSGFRQSRDEGGQEPNVNEVWDVFGFGNRIEGLSLLGGGENSTLNFYDVYLPSDETEVLSPYWRLAEGVSSAKITHIAAFHSPSGAELGIHAPGNKTTDVDFTNHGTNQNQTLLPLLGTGAFATRTFTNATIPDGWTGNDIFGIEVAGLSTDPTLNPTGSGAPTQAQLDAKYPGYTVTNGQVFDPAGNPVSDGYTVRMFQAVDENGAAIPNVYLGIMDYTGINYDYNDNMFIIEGVTPVASAPPPPPPPPPSAQSPYPGPDAPVLAAGGALTVDASNYDQGGQGIAYNDRAGLQGGTNGGRIGSDVEQSAGGDINYIGSGEWLEYTINVAEAGTYDLDLLLATNGGSGRSATVNFYRPGEASPYATSGSIANPVTGSWTNFQTRSADGIELDAGTQVVRVTFSGGSQDFRSFSLDQADAAPPPPPPPSGVNLLANGSFEATDVAVGGTAVLRSVPGWTALEGGRIELWNGYKGLSASNGADLAELDYGGAYDGFYQDVSTTAGQVYDLSFDLRARPDASVATQGVEVVWNGTLVASTAPGAAWAPFNVQVTGTGGQNRLTIREVNSQKGDGRGALLDDFSLTAGSSAAAMAASADAGETAAKATTFGAPDEFMFASSASISGLADASMPGLVGASLDAALASAFTGAPSQTDDADADPFMPSLALLVLEDGSL